MQDGMYTLSEMECMGSCVNAPMIAVADYSGPDARSFKYTYYEDLTPQDAVSIMEDLKAGKTPRVRALCCFAVAHRPCFCMSSITGLLYHADVLERGLYQPLCMLRCPVLANPAHTL